MHDTRVSRAMAIVGLTCTLAAHAAEAQLVTQHVKGLVGLKSGSQPPPGWYVIAPLVYVYDTDEVFDRHGNRLPTNANLTTVAFGAGISAVTSTKVLGANYGFQALFPLGANNRIQGTEIDANPGAGLTDSAFVPISLGWHFTRADAIASYGIFAPTGRYSDGANDNTGFGMWGHEVSVGTTVYLNEARQYHAAALVSFDFQSKKEGSNTKVGNAMNIEGGFGADFLEGGLTAGLNYFGSFKLTADEIDGIPGILIRGKDRVFGLGPEVSLAIARKGTLYGFIKVNYQWEVYARTTTKGNELTIMGTFLTRPLKLPGAQAQKK